MLCLLTPNSPAARAVPTTTRFSCTGSLRKLKMGWWCCVDYPWRPLAFTKRARAAGAPLQVGLGSLLQAPLNTSSLLYFTPLLPSKKCPSSNYFIRVTTSYLWFWQGGSDAEMRMLCVCQVEPAACGRTAADTKGRCWIPHRRQSARAEGKQNM